LVFHSTIRASYFILRYAPRISFYDTRLVFHSTIRASYFILRYAHRISFYDTPPRISNPVGCDVCGPQRSVEAPWLSRVESSCVVVGQGVLMCVDLATLALYTLPIQAEETPQFSRILLQSLDLEVSPGFQPVLVSSQPHPARSPLSEFFLQLGPDHHILLQLHDDGSTIAPLRDFQPAFLVSFATTGEKTVAAVMTPKNETACAINLFSADSGRRLLDTTVIFPLDLNGGKPHKVSVSAGSIGWSGGRKKSELVTWGAAVACGSAYPHPYFNLASKIFTVTPS
ncbi:unnamed protein product, partial [Coregonus sp. 'balchen']